MYLSSAVNLAVFTQFEGEASAFAVFGLKPKRS